MNNEKEIKELKELQALETLLNNMPMEEVDSGFEDKLLNNLFNAVDLSEFGGDKINAFNIEETSEDNFTRAVKNQKRNFKQLKKLKVVGYSLMLIASLFIFVMYSPDILNMKKSEDIGDPMLNELSPGELHKMMCDAYIRHEESLMEREEKLAESGELAKDANFVEGGEAAEAPAVEMAMAYEEAEESEMAMAYDTDDAGFDDSNSEEKEFERDLSTAPTAPLEMTKEAATPLEMTKEAATPLEMTKEAATPLEMTDGVTASEIAETETMTNGGMLIYGVGGAVETTKPELYHHTGNYKNTFIIIMIINLLNVF